MKRFYRPDEVADLLRLSRRTIYRMVGRGDLESIRFGTGSIRIPASALPPEALGMGRLERPLETARRIGMSVSSVYRLYHEGRLPGVMIGEGEYTLRIISGSEPVGKAE